MLSEVVTIVASVSGTCLAATLRPRRGGSRTGLWDVAREAVRGYGARAMERERRTTLVVLARERQPDDVAAQQGTSREDRS